MNTNNNFSEEGFSRDIKDHVIRVLKDESVYRREWDLELFFDNSLALECNKGLRESVERAKQRFGTKIKV